MNTGPVSHNVPCHCGSGKKFRKCHGLERSGSAEAGPSPAVVASCVAVLSVLPFLPGLRGAFLNFDDDINFLNNPHFRGFGLDNVRWMTTALFSGHYHPLTWLTLAADYSLWGMNPFGYHLTSLLFHGACAGVFYLVARRLFAAAGVDGAWPAVLAALAFSVHPLRVESVSWVSERRDVVSGFFYLGAVFFYLQRRLPASWACFAAALLSKVSAITLPAALLLLDVYPLRRLSWSGGWTAPAREALREKLPYLLLAAALTPVFYAAQFDSNYFQQSSHAARLAMSFHGLAFTLSKTLFPVGLAPLYASPEQPDPIPPLFLASAAACIALTAAAVRLRRERPGLLAAWSFHLLTQLPMLRLVNIYGPQMIADRYSYLPTLGWALLFGAGLAARGTRRAAGIAALLLLAALTWRQTGVWRDSESVWRRVVELRPETAMAQYNMGVVREGQGRLDEAERHYREALRVRPAYSHALYNLALLLQRKGRFDEAEAAYRELLRLAPRMAWANLNLGTIQYERKRYAEAASDYRDALRIAPRWALAHMHLGLALEAQGRLVDAEASYREALRLDPRMLAARGNLGGILVRLGRGAEGHALLGSAYLARGDRAAAERHLREALRRDPSSAAASALQESLRGGAPSR